MKRARLVLALLAAVVACDNDETKIAEVAPAAPAPPAPAFTATPIPTPPPPLSANNAPPTLVFRIRPDPASGPAPWTVNVNMCQSSDPDGDPLIFEYKWGGTGRRPDFSRSCRDDHTYTTKGTFHAFFCVHDDHDHRVCWNELIGIF